MAVTYKVVEGTLLTTSAATLYTAPSTVLISIVRSIQICNTDTTARQVALYIMASGGTAAAANTIRKDSSSNTIAIGTTENWDTQIGIAASGFLQGKADSASVVSVRLLIVEIS